MRMMTIASIATPRSSPEEIQLVVAELRSSPVGSIERQSAVRAIGSIGAPAVSTVTPDLNEISKNPKEDSETRRQAQLLLGSVQ
jgi:hypothetical protein